MLINDKNKNYGLEIKKIRQIHNLSQAKMALFLGIHQAVLARWESGAVRLDYFKYRGIVTVFEELLQQSV